jgi:4-(2-carboxyphenyl)-2-oxobut-3-enoate aldolase
MAMTVDDIQGVVGILPSPCTPDGDRWDAVDTVPLAEVEKMTRASVNAGIDILMTTGTFGEAATLTWSELQALVDCVVQNRGGRPVFAGVTTLNTRDTITRARALIDLGATGLFAGRPMWLPLDQRQIVQYYRDIADALPGVPIVIYDNPHAFKGKILTDTYQELAKIKEVVASKHTGGPTLEGDILAVRDTLRMLPLETDWFPMAQKYPKFARASWSGNVACAPTPIGMLSRAILAADWDAAKRLHEECNWAVETMFPGGDIALFMNYSIQLGHARFRTAGLIDPGPTRRPYIGAPDEYIAGCEEVGRRFAELERRYAGKAITV